MRTIIPFPSFSSIGDQAVNGIPGAMLLWIALAQLMSHPDYTSLTPEEAYNKLLLKTREVYSDTD